MTLPIDRTTKTALDANLVNGVTSDAPVVKNSNDNVYNTIDELYNYTSGLVAGGVLQPYPVFLSRQALINGNFDVWQRGTTFNNPNGAYTADRFVIADAIDANVKVLRSTDVPNLKSQFSLRVEGFGAISGVGSLSDIGQFVEDFKYFAGQTITFSGYIKCDAGGISVVPRIDDGVTDTPGQTITSTSWVPFSVTKTISSTNTKLKPYLRVNRSGIAVGVGCSISQLQVNIGNVPLPFQPRSFAEELQLCQRYCHVISSNATNAVIGNGTAASTTQALIYYTFKTQMRVPPTLVATATDWQLADSANAPTNLTAIALFFAQNSEFSTAISAVVASGLTQYRPYVLWANAANKRIILDSEL